MRQKFHYVIGLVSLIVFMLISVIAFYIHKGTEDKIDAQLSKTQLIIAKYIANEIENNINRVISELESITANPDAINMDITNIPYFVKNNLNEVMHTGTLYNMIFVSSEGKITYKYPMNIVDKKLMESYDLTLLEKYKETLHDGFPVLSDIYNLNNDKERAATLFVPLLSSDIEYKGAIGALINMTALRRKYLSLLATLRNYELSIINEDRVFIESVCKEMIRISFFEEASSCTYNSDDPNVAKFIDRVFEDDEGVTSYTLHTTGLSEKIGYPKKFAAFTYSIIANRKWHTIISIPYEEITFFIQKNFHYILVILIITLLFIFGTSFLLFEINKKRIQAEDAELYLRKEAELKEELTLSEEKYKGIMDDASEGIAIFKGIEIIEVNQTWADMFETTAEKCKGLSIYDIVQKGSVEQVKDYFYRKDTEDDETPKHYDITVTTRNGRKRTHNISLSRLTALENMACMVSRDVTEKREEEQEINDAKSRLEKANKELDFYVSSIVHDIKNPLVVAQGFINILVNEFTSDSNKQKDLYIDKIQYNISHIFDLLNSLLDLSKIGRVKKQIERIDLKKEIRMVKGYLSSFLDEKDAEIKILNDLPVVYTDRGLLTQILENLIGNAVKFSKEGIPPVIKIGSKDLGEFIEFSVADNGIGIDDKHKKLIFKVFGRIDEDTQGSGVGLNIVKKVVDELGGSLSFESEYGEGTTFYFTIPKKKNYLYLKELNFPA